MDLSRLGQASLYTLSPYLQRHVPSVWHVTSPCFPTYRSAWGRDRSDMFIGPASIPTEACHARVWHVKCPCVPTYRGLSRLGLACLFALRPYLQRTVMPALTCLVSALPTEYSLARVGHV